MWHRLPQQKPVRSQECTPDIDLKIADLQVRTEKTPAFRVSSHLTGIVTFVCEFPAGFLVS